MDEEYKAYATLYFVPTMTGSKGIIALDFNEYAKLLAMGYMDKDILLTLTKSEVGDEYPDGAPKWEGKAGLYGIRIEGTHLKPQVEISENDFKEISNRGLKDGDNVAIAVKAYPNAMPRSANYDDVDLKFDF